MISKFRRYGQIADVLVKHGLGIFVRKLFPRIHRFRRCKACPVESVSSVAEQIRLAIEELGPTFIKFGQILSTRREILPPPLIEELRKLQDRTNPLPFLEIQSAIEEVFPNYFDYFRGIDNVPIASASLAQVHQAWLMDGTPVAVKVQRPGIRDIIETDLLILDSIAKRIEHAYPELRVYNLTGMVDDFSHQIRNELDFSLDGRNAEILRKNLQGQKGVKVPKVYWEHSSPHLLVMEYVEGVRVDNVAAIREMGVDPRQVARAGFNAYLKQIFEDGFFHGDPHPGNLLVTRDGKLVFLDFGIVGIIRPERRFMFIRLLRSFVEQDPLMMIKALEGLGVKIREEDRESLRDDIYIALIQSQGEEIGEIQFREMATHFTETLRRYHLEVPMNLMLMLKVLVMALDDGVVLDPGFQFSKEARPFAEEHATAGSLFEQFKYRGEHSLMEAIDGLFDLPRNVNRTLERISSGVFKIDILESDIKKFSVALDRTSDRIVVGLVIAAIVVGSSLVLSTPSGTFPSFIIYLAGGGYIIAILIGFFAVYEALFKSGI
jgi:ubiquinone biosynthesis protein